MNDWTDLAAWYDVMNPWGPSDDFYLDLVMGARRVLDVGCGTGRLLHRARAAGHTDRLCGLDPDPAVLARAGVRTDIEWVLARAEQATWNGEFDLAVMASHAFQFLTTDDELRASLRAVRTALVAGGRFAFETRHPLARAWEDWDGASFEVRNPDGEPAQVSYAVPEVVGDVVHVTETLAGQWWNEPRTERAAMRFLHPDALTAFLHGAGFTIDAQFGDWHGGPLTDTSEEIITIARA